jgi:hypothetical protein
LNGEYIAVKVRIRAFQSDEAICGTFSGGAWPDRDRGIGTP